MKNSNCVFRFYQVSASTARHKQSSYQHVTLIQLAWAVAVCGVVTVVIL